MPLSKHSEAPMSLHKPSFFRNKSVQEKSMDARRGPLCASLLNQMNQLLLLLAIVEHERELIRGRL
jgi:hypothetical protein